MVPCLPPGHCVRTRHERFGRGPSSKVSVGCSHRSGGGNSGPCHRGFPLPETVAPEELFINTHLPLIVAKDRAPTRPWVKTSEIWGPAPPPFSPGWALQGTLLFEFRCLVPVGGCGTGQVSSLSGEGLARTGQSPGVSPGSPCLVDLAALAWRCRHLGRDPLAVAACPAPCRRLSLTLRHALQHAHHVYHPDQLRVHGPARPSTLDQVCRVSIFRASPASPSRPAFSIPDSWPQSYPSRGPGTHPPGGGGWSLP